MEKLNDLVNSLYPRYGTPGSRDVEITALRQVINEKAKEIADEFRKLEQRAEATEAALAAEIISHRKHAAILISDRGLLRGRAEEAEAKLAELEKQDPVGYTYSRGINCEIVVADLNDDCPCGADLFTHPVPAVSLAELMPDEIKIAVTEGVRHGIIDGEIVDPHRADGWNACRAAILRNIEGAK